jgi:chromate reductase
MINPKIKILVISGSLRANSSTHSVIQTLVKLAPSNTQMILYGGLGSLPPFDDSQQAPASVTDLRKQIAEADAVLLCTPEYAFGVPGILKNALDWTVGSGELTDKPVAVVTAALGGDKAHASLLLTLSALSSKVIEGASSVTSFIRAKINKQGEVVDQDTLNNLKNVMTAVANYFENVK